jgi:hypothetical protein
MIEWLKNLEPEFLMIFGLLAVLVFVTLVLLVKAQRTLNLIGRRALILTEDLLKRDGVDVVDIMVANTSYVNVEAAAIGLIYQKKLLPLKEENTIILARDSHKLTLPIQELRDYVLGTDKKIRTIKMYVEDSLGRRSFRRARNSKRYLKKVLKQEKKAARIEAKRVRFETGSYTFFERIGLVFAVLWSPFGKTFKAIRLGLNRKLKLREERLELKKKELEHQMMLREVAEEERREEERAKLEKRLMEEKKKANIEARKAALRRQEEARILAKEMKETEEELKLAEAEAALHDIENVTNKQEENVQLDETNVEKTEPTKEDKPLKDTADAPVNPEEKPVKKTTTRKKKTTSKTDDVNEKSNDQHDEGTQE